MVGCGGCGWGSCSGGVFRARMGDAPSAAEWIPAPRSAYPPHATSAGMTMVGLARGSGWASHRLDVGVVLAPTERARCPRSQAGDPGREIPGGRAVAVTVGSVGDTHSAAVDQHQGSWLGRSLALPF